MNYGYPQNPASYYQPQNQYQYNPSALSPQQRLYNYEQQYGQVYAQPQMQQQPQQSLQPQQQAAAQPTQAQSPIMAVSNEQQARDYPADLSGALQMFVLQDDSAIFAKRFNTATALIEFEVYEKRIAEKPTTDSVSIQDNSFLLGIVGNFSTKLEDMYTEIQELRKDVQNNGSQPNVNSKPNGKQKPTDAASNAADTGDGASRK